MPYLRLRIVADWLFTVLLFVSLCLAALAQESPADSQSQPQSSQLKNVPRFSPRDSLHKPHHSAVNPSTPGIAPQ